jgi:predicted nuclease of predicted toxin-antitoxin system
MSLPFLADESCDFGVVRALRSAGFQVTAVSEVAPGADDNVVIDLANREKSILITEDKDFGQLVYASGHESVGVLLVRYPFPSRKKLFKDIVQLVRQSGDELVGAFTVLQPGRVRIGRMPGTYEPDQTP